jgi:hypothetical protein
MFTNPLVLADRLREDQFTTLGQTHDLFRSFDVYRDDSGVVWARTQHDGHTFAVSLLPNWCFDPYVQRLHADKLAEFHNNMERAKIGEYRSTLRSILSRLRFYRTAERLIWVIQQRVMQAKRSSVLIPDELLARAVWGPNSHARPQEWRQSLREVLESLARLHVSVPGDNTPLGQHTAVLTHTVDYEGSDRDQCEEDCPGRDRFPHSHVLVIIGAGFLGALEQYAKPAGKLGIRNYDFTALGGESGTPTLQTINKRGPLVWVYLPAKIGQPAACSQLSPRRGRLLQAIVRETTCNTRPCRDDLNAAEVFVGNEVPGIHGRGNPIACPLLVPGVEYVGFNGNGPRKGQGYAASTGGWITRAGYDCNELELFYADLATLAEPLGLIAVGIHVPNRECFDLGQLQTLAETAAGRTKLARTHLRIYTTADYIQRWNDHFGWGKHGPAQPFWQASLTARLAAQMERRRVSRQKLAEGIKVDVSLMGEIFRGEKPWLPGLLFEAQKYVGRVPYPSSSRPSDSTFLRVLRRVEGGHAIYLAAKEYNALGWSVVPVDPNTQQPAVDWKPFQDRRPTEDELIDWFIGMPDALIGVVLGPTSGLFAIHVDGNEAHRVLLEHLGHHPRAPEVLCRREIHRYCLFFQCPEIPTNAMATPWHPQLEFRGSGGLVALPPSRHASNNPFVWADRQSPADLPLPALPDRIMASLR